MLQHEELQLGQKSGSEESCQLGAEIPLSPCKIKVIYRNFFPKLRFFRLKNPSQHDKQTAVQKIEMIDLAAEIIDQPIITIEDLPTPKKPR